MWVMRREPSLMREAWMMMWTAEAIWARMAFSGREMLPIMAMVSMRAMASRGLLAWMVVIDPSWPVFMAWSMSSAS